MILIDTSIWVDHLSSGVRTVERLLLQNDVLMHPFIVGELALGNIANRAAVLAALRDLPRAAVAYDDELLRLIDTDQLYGTGIGYVDAHLIASTRLNPGTTLLTRDKRLLAVAERLNIVASFP